MGWLFGGRRDLWPDALEAIADPKWFDVFQEEGLWSTEEAAWVIAAWIARDFQDRDRLDCACKWQDCLHRPFTEKIGSRLLHANDLDDIWTRVWRLFCLVEPVVRSSTAHYEMQKRLASRVVLYNDLQEAVRLLAPGLNLRRRSDPAVGGDDGSQPTRVGHIVHAHMAISDRHGAGELVTTLCAFKDRAREILDLTTATLRSALELEAEFEMIDDDHDINDYTVPSIEEHSQNKYREGVNFLVRVLAGSLPQATAFDRSHTRGVVHGWKNMPGRIGLRLCLHAMRNAELFDADEAMSTLLGVSDVEFWTIRREIALLLKDRTGAAAPALVNRVEERIRHTGKAYYDRYTVEPGETDWRANLRDAAVWLRLKMLQDSGVLSETGAEELSAIKKRRDYLNREVEDRDFLSLLKFVWVAVAPAECLHSRERASR